MHKYDKIICKNHYCDICLHIDRKSDQEPCFYCTNGTCVYMENCYWEKNLTYIEDQMQYIVGLLKELTEEQRLEIFSCFSE